MEISELEQDGSQRRRANVRRTLQDICNDDDVIKCLCAYYWCLEGDDKILIRCHALTGVDVTKVKFRNVFMTVTPRHAPRDTCDEGLPMPTFYVLRKTYMKESRLIWLTTSGSGYHWLGNFLSLYFQMLLVISFPRKGKHIQGRAQSRLGVFFDSIKCMKPN